MKGEEDQGRQVKEQRKRGRRQGNVQLGPATQRLRDAEQQQDEDLEQRTAVSTTAGPTS